MSKATIIALIALLFSATGTFLIREGKADPYPMPGVMIRLENLQNVTYNDNTVLVTFRAMEVYFRSNVNFSYALDNLESVSISNITTISEDMRLLYADVVYCKIIKGNFTLFNLSDGWHNLTVYCQTNELSQNTTYLFGTYSDEHSVDFLVDTVPKISVLSMENRTFDSSTIPLTFTVNQQTSKIQYSLDGLQNTTINGNTTLTYLSNGMHNITIYAWDEASNIGFSKTTHFSVVPSFPIVSVIVASTALGVVAFVGFFYYFRKRT